MTAGWGTDSRDVKSRISLLKQNSSSISYGESCLPSANVALRMSLDYLIGIIELPHNIIIQIFFRCGHCKRLAPEYEKAATTLKNEDPAVPLIKVDCTTSQDTCSKHGVSGYPSLKVFRNGEVAKDYSGPREADGIVRSMRTEAGPSSRELKSSSDLDKFLGGSEAVVVGYISSAAGAVKDLYHKMADGLKEELRFAHTAADDMLTTHKDKIVIHRPKRLHNKFEPEHVVCDAGETTDAAGLKQCVTEGVHGLVGHRTSANVANFKNPLLTVYYNVDYIKDPKGSNYWRNRILKVRQCVLSSLENFLVQVVCAAFI